MLGALFFYRKNMQEKEKLNTLLIKQKEEILQQNDSLIKLNKDKNKLFSILTHDLKSPINSIKQLLDLFNLELLNDQEKKEIIQHLQKQIKQTDQMMDELLHWSLAQMEGIVTNRIALDVNRLISHNLVNQEIAAEKKGVKLEFQPLAETLGILADKTQFKIIFQNCLQNSIKFSHPGGTIKISIETGERNVLVKIKDQGVGIPPEKIREIMTNKNMISSTIGTVEEQGTGLGLLLTKQFLEKNQGFLSISSEVGKGAEVILGFEKAEFSQIMQEEKEQLQQIF
jgi:signal transduction histidine kinase